MLPKYNSNNDSIIKTFPLKHNLFKNKRRSLSVIPKLPTFNSKNSLLNDEKKIKKRGNSTLRKMPSELSNSNLSLKIILNAISVEDRKNLKKINNNTFNIQNNNNKLNSKNKNLFKLKLDKSIKNYIQNMNHKIDEDDKKNQQYNLFNNNYSKGKIKPKLSGLFTLKNGDKLKQNKSYTFLIKKSKPKENFLKQLILVKNNENSLKSSIKIQNIKWLWTNKSYIIEKLIFFFQDYKWFFEKNKYVNKDILKEFMSITNIEHDIIFIDNLFLLFDYEGQGNIDFKKVLFTLIISSNKNYEQKIRLIINLLNEKDGSLKLKDFNDLLINTISYKNRKNLIDIIKEELRIKEINILIQKKNILDILLNNKKIIRILNNLFIDIDNMINDVDSEINNVFIDIMKISQNSLFSHFNKRLICNDIKKLDQIVKSMQTKYKLNKNIDKVFSDENEEINSNEIYINKSNNIYEFESKL